MNRNPEKFPCEMDGNYVNLDTCDECKNKEKCDTYITMLNETEYEE